MPYDKDFIKNATLNALKMMEDSGFEISDNLEVVVDPELPFMGYSTKRRSGHVIVVSGMALESGLVEGLLIHEMSHIYRTETNHPSYNHKLLESVMRTIVYKNRIIEDYQLNIIHQAINHIQDLYADDIAFKVFEKSKLLTLDQIRDFFLSWIKDTLIESKSIKEKWLNVGIMLNNCFAISNMIRHSTKDIGKAEDLIRRFLSQTDDSMEKEFMLFRNFMINLKENISEKEFEKDLVDYLTRMIRLVK